MGFGPAIVVSDISKKFALYDNQLDRLREALHPLKRTYHREFWALRDISLDIMRGDIVGIMGRNGSGKSTLLHIIAGTIQPNSGNVKQCGRISSLLELGGGFNPDFTGRENVVINSAIHGLSTTAIKERIPAIEAFADIGDFFYQPVKTYSSGMFVRLAFASAIHVDPEILIVDEALAVGDAAFQQRCFEKFNEFKAAGVTIIFVSHDNEMILRHCNRAVLLEQGHVVAAGEPKEVASRYIDLLEGRTNLTALLAQQVEMESEAEKIEGHLATGNPLPATTERNKFFEERPKDDRSSTRPNYNRGEIVHAHPAATIVDHMIIAGEHTNPTHVTSGDTLDIYFKVRFFESIESPCFGLSVKTKDGMTVYALNSHWTDTRCEARDAGDYLIAHFRVSLTMNNGPCFLDFGVDRDIGESYEPIVRRMFVVQLEMRTSHVFHGLVDMGAEFKEVSI